MQTQREPHIVQIEVGLVQNFCTLLCDPRQGVCAIVDPAFEVDRLLQAIASQGLRPGAVLLTHSHFDHIEGVPALLRSANVPVYVGADESAAVAAVCREADQPIDLRPLAGDETLRIGGLFVTVLATPGHTAAGRSFYVPELSSVITGDTLFVGSCGRPASAVTAKTLWRSLERLAELPEETRIYPGHDYGHTATSTIGWERERNPYLACKDEAAFAALCRARMGQARDP
jgi:glyoxylase-like metal-dependent hydrolase (beta-lactamase superfamily II)